jgi:hypothetical protein
VNVVNVVPTDKESTQMKHDPTTPDDPYYWSI